MPGGDAPSWTHEVGIWVRAPLAITPPWWAERLDSAAQGDGLTGPLDPSQDFTQLWAWIDEPGGTIRMRTFAGRVGIAEDEACGTGAMRLSAALGRRVVVHHGVGSVIHAAPGPAGYAEIGGQVAETDQRQV